jgi:acyl carrier protein
MTRERILDVVQEKIGEVLGIPAAEIGEYADLVTEHTVDSLEMMEVAARLEKALRIQIAVDRFRDVVTPGDVADYLYTRLNER